MKDKIPPQLVSKKKTALPNASPVADSKQRRAPLNEAIQTDSASRIHDSLPEELSTGFFFFFFFHLNAVGLNA